MSTIMNQQQYSSTSSNISNRKIIGQHAKKTNLANPQSSNRILSASPPSLETSASVTNKNRKLKSWRSSGWAPLSYPSLALYSHENSTTTITTNPSNTHRDITNPNANPNANAINPFFPLHKDVILAAARELFILDKAIESSTMETNTTMDAIKNRKEKGMIDINSNHGDIDIQGFSNQKQTAAHDDDTKDPQTHENQISFSSFSEKESDKNHLLIRKRKRRGSGNEGITHSTPVTTTNTNAGTVKAVIINEKVKLKPSHHSHHTTVTENSNDDENANDKKNHSNLTAETLTNLVLQNILNNLFRDDQIPSHVKEKETSTLALASNNPTTTATMDHNSNRIRKVSDAGMDAPSVSSTSAFAPLPMPAISCSTALTSSSTQSPYAAHLAVVAINLSGFEDAIEHVDIDANDIDKELLLSLQIKNQMPQMLDLSIMVEAHLRKIALRMVYSFRDFVSDKALREFLGYKTAKNGRVLELISDFLFDVSHAMFAWEKTEKDMYGNKSTNTTTVVDYKSHDSTICKALFDNRALRKIGGFEQTSLLTHALSIKRLRASGESWATSANTTAGKQMMLHHRDNSSRVRAGAKRRDKRTKKNICTILDEKDNNKSRSSSIISMDRRGNDGTNGAELKISTDSLYNDVSMRRVQPSCISPVHDLIPITITREEGKSWGILLAREGSMCAVMRVPDSPEHQLQRGDLIVSICNEDQERVNTPTLHSSNTVSPEWFSEAVGIFKRSNALQLEIRRVHSPTSKVDA